MKLLIVEDSGLVSERLRHSFAGIPGLAVDAAGRADEGLERFRNWQPNTVILDIDLPGGNGLDLLRTIKRECSETRVLMFSNHDCYRTYCQQAGADAFFDKARDFEALTDFVREMTEMSGARPSSPGFH